MRTKNTRARRVCVVVCTAPLLVLGSAVTASSALAAAPAASVVLAPQASTPGEILTLVNAERDKAGCEPLKVDPRLAQAAQAHADDMAANQITDHTGSDGSTYLVRMERAGYSPNGPSSENVSGPGYADSKAHVDGWMASDRGHRAAILNCTYKETGIGTSGDYAVELFAVSAR
ncbi:CAP domain-containing protein [Streptomyces sp. NBC_00249]|uniref:CAP domain-containing protein n=1 Tax=Streptomyces sp. NBC_00249 TaxID=2975690 RepID=UPI00225A176E|nr:CAP domain-containing protein [Streptomyces sp. NBC_00249]MCX5192451.1 CAP domain-containing protein [Streptomyces sp. NBC_00249]